MTRSTNSITALCGLSLSLVLSGCAGKDDAATDSIASPTPSASAVATADTNPKSAAGAPGALLDPNTATREQLMALPRRDAALADSIVARRPYENMLAVERILATKLSETQRDAIYERMFKPLDLNTATKEEIMLIPGVGERMHHEFEEYRPYRDMARFRREIAKYVADSTVARYERYVTIR